MEESRVYLSGTQVLAVRWKALKEGEKPQLCFYVLCKNGEKRFIPLCKGKRYKLVSQYGNMSEIIQILETRVKLKF
jgi:hypothetical protein